MILVAGGTGRLGQLLVEQLVSGDLPVRVLSRGLRPLTRRVEGVEYVSGDVRSAEAVRAAMRGVTVAVSAVQGLTGGGGGSPAAVDRDGNGTLVRSAVVAGARMVLLSVVGASPDSRLELFRMKWAAEESLRVQRNPLDHRACHRVRRDLGRGPA